MGPDFIELSFEGLTNLFTICHSKFDIISKQAHNLFCNRIISHLFIESVKLSNGRKKTKKKINKSVWHVACGMWHKWKKECCLTLFTLSIIKSMKNVGSKKLSFEKHDKFDFIHCNTNHSPFSLQPSEIHYTLHNFWSSRKWKEQK